MMKFKNKYKPAYLFGPFIGELSWEFYRFAPYAIRLKRRQPDIKLIVFTRDSRFDLYGRYADILVPLRIPGDEKKKKECFRLQGFLNRDYQKLAKHFRSKYKKQYEIIKHFYPDTSLWRYRVKWQLPRSKMDYSFLPRKMNERIAKLLVNPHDILVEYDDIEYNDDKYVKVSELVDKITDMIDGYTCTILGVLIEAIKLCDVVVGSLDSKLAHLALLMKTPVITFDNNISNDKLKLMNPFSTKVVLSNSIEEGLSMI